LAKKVDRKNLGIVFNLCHFLIRDDEPNLEPRLKEAAPYLFGVSVSGADSGYKYSKDWTHLVMTLDRGNFDIVRMLKPLKQLGYEGPIGLQCHDLQGDPRENLTRSMNGWRKLKARVAAEMPVSHGEAN
jgi:sugar phosphate isomerase/epimerase